MKNNIIQKYHGVVARKQRDMPHKNGEDGALEGENMSLQAWESFDHGDRSNNDGIATTSEEASRSIRPQPPWRPIPVVYELGIEKDVPFERRFVVRA